MIGELLAHYRILDRLGSGAMGEVYLAEDLNLRRTVALKVLPRRLADDEVARERLLREARAASRVGHANIATIYDVDEADGRLYLAMEYVDGQPLEKRIREGLLPPLDVVKIGIQIADALDAAHHRGVIHRDVKPTNILVDGNGVVKVVDFGLAWQTPLEDESSASHAPTEGDRLTKTGFAAGTVTYMSPEQAGGEKLDGRSDVFALGVVLYEAATGRLPFVGPNPLAVAAAIMHDTPPPPRQRVAELPPKLEEIILACLAKDPSQRPQSAAQVRDALLLMAEGRTWLWWPSGALPPPITDTEAARYFEQARSYEARGYVRSNMKMTEDLYRAALDLEPDNLFLKGQLARFLSNYQLLEHSAERGEEVRRLSDEVIAVAPALAPAWAARGRLLLLEGEPEAAAEAARQVIETEPDSHAGYVILGEALIAMGRTTEGLEQLDAGIDTGPGHVFARERKARVLYNMGKLEEAAVEYVKVLEYAPGSPSALTNLGAIYLVRQQYREAVVQFKRLLELKPDDIAASNLGTAYFFLGDYGLAVEAYREAIELAPDRATHKRNLGDAYEALDDRDLAVTWWERALEDYDRAIEEASEAERALVRAERATTLLKVGRVDAAVAEVDKSVEQDRNDISILFHAVIIHAAAGDRERVLELMRMMIEKGFPRDGFSDQPSLERYLDDPEFREILESSS
jgi:tetratricopeptide (TPR) repeat protein/predicted Ser/Thr protein kinase